MLKKLSQISNISSGYNFRGPIKNLENGDLFVIQGKNVLSDEDIKITKGLNQVSPKNIRSPFFLKHNDILLVSRGLEHGTFRSSIFIAEEKNIITSSSVYVIRITDITVLPKYVSLYLNSTEGQSKLLQISSGGSYIKTILMKNLVDLEITIPPINIQKAIIDLYENMSEQNKLMNRKKEIYQNIIKTFFNNLK